MEENNTNIIDANVIEIDETTENETQEISLEEAKGVIEYNYRAPLISVEDEFKNLPQKEQSRYMHKLASAMNHAAKLLQDERNELLVKVDNLKEDVKNADAQATVQKNINHQLMTKMNEIIQENAVVLQTEQKRVKQLETVVKAAGLSLEQ